MATYDVDDATHWLSCSHCIGRNTTAYSMRCLPLKNMADGRVKIVVFGERYYHSRNHLQRVRYVPVTRLTSMVDAVC